MRLFSKRLELQLLVPSKRVGTGTALTHTIGNICDYSPHQKIVIYVTKSINCEVSACCFANTFAIAAARDRSGRMLSVVTDLASVLWQRVCRRCSQRTFLVDLP